MRIVAIQIVGRNEKRLEENLKDFKRLNPDEIVIVGNNVSEQDKKTILKYATQFYEDDREWGKFQPDIKTDLLDFCRRLEPDWILAKDADEFYDPRLTREKLEALANKGGIGYYSYIVNYWNDEDHYVNPFWNIRFYKFAPELGLKFQSKALHCGLAPPVVYKYGNYMPHIHIHYGLMDKEDREKKVRRYKKYDPNAVYKDRSYYDLLASETKGERLFNIETLRKKVADEVASYKMKNIPKDIKTEEGFSYLTNGDRTIDVPTKDVRKYERMGWKVLSKIIAHDIQGNICQVCDQKFEDEESKEIHQRTHRTRKQ